MDKVKRSNEAAGLAALMLVFGLLVSSMGFSIVHQWSSIGPELATCGILWSIMGPLAAIAGIWTLLPLGNSRILPAIGGTAALVSGGFLIVGVLASIVPCSGTG